MAIYLHHQVVIDRLLRWKGKAKANKLRFGTRIHELVIARELHSVGAVPEQALLTMRKIEIDIDATAVERQLMRICQRLCAQDLLALDFALHSLFLCRPIAGIWRKLLLLCAPGGSNFGL